MSGTVDIALLPAFVEVVQRGSFTAAAAALGLPKSTVSRRVSRLERELGVQLLVRTTRQLRLTEAGETFYARVAGTVEAVEEAAREVIELQDEPRGHLRVTAPQDIAMILGAVSARFTERYPRLELELVMTPRVVDLVREGVDVAIRAGTLPDSSLVARKLIEDDMRLFASEAYLDRAGRPRSVAELAEHDCVLFRSRDGKGRWTLEGPAGREVVEVSGPVAGDDFAFVAAAVAAGAGIGLLPTLSVPAAGHVECVLPELAAPAGAIYVVYPGSRHVPAKVRAFRDFLLTEFIEALPTIPSCPARRPSAG